MKESTFIRNNEASWQRLEELIDTPSGNPEEVQELFVKVSGDLSYARTFFPRRAVRTYLNDLVNLVFDSMQTKKELSAISTLKSFYPGIHSRVVYRHRWAFQLALLLFIVCITIGAVSAFGDAEFARNILGEYYVTMTTENINNGDPMAVYKDANHIEMFMGITLNNIRVAFLTFVLGVFAGVGTFYILVKNAVMVGVFQAFFAKQGLFLTSFMTIWIHGTIEISSIVVAGAAGFILGRGILLPGSYTRGVSMANASIEALIIILGTVPLFCIAGFLEGFVTRMTDLPSIVKLLIIGLSLMLILTIYVVLPRRYASRNRRLVDSRGLFIDRELNDHTVITREQPFAFALAQLRSDFFDIFVKALLPALVILGLIMGLLIYGIRAELDASFLEGNVSMAAALHEAYGFGFIMCFAIIVAIYLSKCNLILQGRKSSISDILHHVGRFSYAYFMPIVLLLAVVFYVDAWYILLGCLMLLPWPGMLHGAYRSGEVESYDIAAYITDTMKMYRYFQAILLAQLLLVLMGYLLHLIVSGFMGSLIGDMLSWLPIIDSYVVQQQFISWMLMLMVGLSVLPFALLLFHGKLHHAERIKTAQDLDERMENITVLS